MYKNNKPINADLYQTLGSFSQKFIVDLSSGINVSKDHISFQKNRGQFFQRLFDGFTGDAHRRQNQINQNFAGTLDGFLELLQHLNHEVAQSGLALEKLNDEVTQLSNDFSELAEYSMETRQMLESLSSDLDSRLIIMQHEINEIGFRQKAHIAITQVFDKWKAGRIRGLSLAGCCYAAMEELRWGAFGDYYRNPNNTDREAFLSQIIDKATVLLAEDAQVNSTSRLSTYDTWLSPPKSTAHQADWQQALGYLADGFDQEAAPFIISTTQALAFRLDEVPVIANASRIAEAITLEVFEDKKYA